MIFVFENEALVQSLMMFQLGNVDLQISSSSAKSVVLKLDVI